jgi:hypothetical protein
MGREVKCGPEDKSAGGRKGRIWPGRRRCRGQGDSDLKRRPRRPWGWWGYRGSELKRRRGSCAEGPGYRRIQYWW